MGQREGQHDTELVTALMEALHEGGIGLQVGKIDGHVGYYSPTDRTIYLDPDSPAGPLREGIRTALRALASRRPTLRLIEGGRA